MKCLIIQSDGEHKGQDGWCPNWYLRECYAIQHALKCNYIESDIWGLRHDNFEITPDFNSYDAVFCLENYECAWLPNSKEIKPLKLQWIIDLHCQPPTVYDAVSENVDIVLHSTKCLIDSYASRHPSKKHIWFPNGVDDRYFTKKISDKEFDVSFVGSKNPARKEIIEKLENEIGLKYFFATGNEMFRIIASSKIHFNKNISVDMNYRIFETIGLGTAIVTNEDFTLSELGFIDGENAIIYDSDENAGRKIMQHLNDGTWQQIAANGNELAREHSYTKRIESLLKQL